MALNNLGFGFHFNVTGTANVTYHLRQIETSLLKLTALTKQFSGELGNWDTQINRAFRDLAKTHQMMEQFSRKSQVELAKTNRLLVETEKASNFAAHGAARIGQGFYRSSRLAGGFFGYTSVGFGKLNIAAVGFTGVLVGAFINALNTFRTFEKEMMSAFTLISDQATTSIGGLSGMMQDAKDIAFKYGQTLEDVAKGFREALGTGVDPRFVKSFMEITAELAVGGKTSIDIAQRGVLMLANAYHIAFSETEKLNSINDALFSGFNFGNITIEQLSKNIGKAAATAKQLGVSIEELVGSAAGLTLESRSANVVFTDMNRLLLGFLNPMPSYAEKMHEIGIVTGETAITIHGGLIPAILDAMEKMKIANKIPAQMFQQQNAQRAFAIYKDGFNALGLNSQKFASMIERNKTFEELSNRIGMVGENAKRFLGEVFGSMQIEGQEGEIQLQRIANQYGITLAELKNAFSGTTADFIVQNKAMGGAAMALFKELYHPLEGMASTTGSVTRDAFKKMASTLDFSLNQLSASAQTAGVDLIDSLKPALTFLSAFGSATFTLLEIIGGGFKAVFGGMGVDLTAATEKLKAWQAQLKESMTIQEGQTVAPIYQDFLDSSAMTQAQKGINSLGDAFSRLGLAIWESVGKIFSTIGTSISDFINRAMPTISGTLDFFIGVLNFLTPIVSGFINGFGSVISFMIKTLQFAFSLAFDVLNFTFMLFKPVLDLIYWGFQQLGEGIGIVLGWVSGALDFVTANLTSVLDYVEFGILSFKTLIIEGISSVVAAFGWLGGQIYHVFATTVNKVVDLLGPVAGWVESLVNSIGGLVGMEPIQLKLKVPEPATFDALKNQIQQGLGGGAPGISELWSQKENQTQQNANIMGAFDIMKSTLASAAKPSGTASPESQRNANIMGAFDIMKSTLGSVARSNANPYMTGSKFGPTPIIIPDDMRDMMEEGLDLGRAQNFSMQDLSNGMDMSTGLLNDQLDRQSPQRPTQEPSIGRSYEQMATSPSAFPPSDKRTEKMILNINLKDDDGVEKRAKIEQKRNVDTQFRNWYNEVKP